MKQAPGHDDVLGHRPVPAERRRRDAEGLADRAQVGASGAAGRAVAAPHDRVERDARARDPRLGARTHRLHDPRGLVAHDHGRDAPTGGPGVAVDVRAADGDRLDPDQHLPRTGHGIRPVRVLEPQGAGVDERLHRLSPCRGSTWILGASPQPGWRRPARTPATSSSETVAAMSGSGSTAPEAYRLGDALQPAGGAEHADGRHVLERHRARVDQAGLAGEADVDHAAPGFDEVQGQGRQPRRVGGVHHGVPAQVGMRLPRPGVPEAERPARRSETARSVRPGGPRCPSLPRSAPPAARWFRPPAPAVARRASSPAPHTARSALPPGSTIAPADGPTDSGSGTSARTGTGSCSASAPGQPWRTPISWRSAHRCWRPLVQRPQVPQPSIVSPVTRRPIHDGSTPVPDRRDRAGPLVADPDGIRGLVRVQVGHLAGVELDVRAADARPLDVDDHLAGPGLRPRQLAHLRGAGARDHERPHRHRHAVSRMPTMMP